jgi:peptidoglycan/LPS O-acetylase OafA/YrhL
MIESYLANKLTVDQPGLTNLILLLGLVALGAVTARRTAPSEPLGIPQTKQVRGCIILLIVIGHLWTHVSSSRSWPNLAGDSVAAFLFMSGFGVMLSYMNRRPCPADFLKARFLRIFMPYWLATLLFFALDKAFLGSTLGFRDAVLTLAGINLNEATRLFDFTRWYVTFQLFWYLAFIAVFSVLPLKRGALALMATAPLLFLADYYFIHVDWSKYLAFPAGCLAGLYRKSIVEFIRRHPIATLGAALISLAVLLEIKYAMYSGQTVWLPSVARIGLWEINGLLWTVFLLSTFALLGLAGISCMAYLYAGAISYELYLLHGPLLIKYNPVFFLATEYDVPLPVCFALLLILLAALSTVLKKTGAIRGR